MSFSYDINYYKNKAKDLNLGNNKEWLNLLHFNNESEIDDPSFFVSTNGKFNSYDELDKSIESLFTFNSDKNKSFICKFPARTSWLLKNLQIKNLELHNCPEYDKLYKRLDPQKATLIFSSAHINSPASMFGHTFLRIDSSYESKLLSYAVNYSAMADQKTENGFIFAIKGLFGGYYGKYSLLPYYEKLKEYSDTEQRDIWEYNLNLDKKEIDRMVQHIWELNNIYSNYFFFDENCSYNLLWLLEIARPNLKLREDYFYYVNPPETIFTLEKNNLISSIEYRASKRKKILALEKKLNPSKIEFVKNLSNGNVSILNNFNFKNYSLNDRIYILDAAIEYTEYIYIENQIDKNTYLSTFHALNKYRSLLGKTEKLKLTKPKNPLDGHNTLKLSFQYQKKNDDYYTILNFRPSYHDITNDNSGFMSGTEIKFFDLNLKYSDDKIQLDNLDLLSIGSYAHRTDLFKPLSWRTKFNIGENYLDYKKHLNISLGLGWTWENILGYHYVLLEQKSVLKDSNSFGIGPTIGFTLFEDKSIKTNIEYQKNFYIKESQNDFQITQSFYPKRNLEFQLKYRYLEKEVKSENILNFAINLFF